MKAKKRTQILESLDVLQESIGLIVDTFASGNLLGTAVEIRRILEMQENEILKIRKQVDNTEIIVGKKFKVGKVDES